MIANLNQNKRIELEVKKLGIFELRGLAREVGVPSPTTKKRDELIKGILDRIYRGGLEEVVVQKKGRPYKKLAGVDNILSNMTIQENFVGQTKPLSFEEILAFAQVMPVMGKTTNEEGCFSGIARKSANNDFYMFYDVSTDDAIFLPIELAFASLIQNGDEIECVAKKVNSNQYFATKVTKINGIEPSIYSNKKVVLGEAIISNQTIDLDNKKIFVGRRNLAFVEEDFYENPLFEKLEKQAQKNGCKIVYLSLNSSIEDDIKLKHASGYVFSSRFDDACTKSLNKALDCINLCDNLLERGQKVMLIVPDIMNVIRVLDHCFVDENKMYGHSSQSIIVAQKILSLGKAFSSGISLTVFLGCSNLDKADEYVEGSLVKICKLL